MGRPPGRPRKAEAEAKPAPAPKAPTTDDFIRTRDSVVTGLATLQSAIQDLSRAYIAHTNTIIAGGASNPHELLALSNPLGQNGFSLPRMLHVADHPPDLPQDATTAAARPKKPKRAHDPNAPKRPLTPYFLYMQTARAVIAGDLGAGATPGEVSAEGTRRWLALPDQQKEGWRAAYLENLRRYQEAKATYLAGLAGNDGPAAQLAAENGAAHHHDDDDDDDDDDEDVSASVPDPALDVVDAAPAPASPKTTNKRRKSAGEQPTNGKSPAVAARPLVRETEVLPPSMSRLSSSHGPSKSPDRKRTRRERKSTSKAPAPAAANVEDSEPAPEKERRSKRKRKSDLDAA